MADLPRLLVLIGSGETAAHMARGHRSIVRRLMGPNGRPGDVRAALIDTPYGFQSNADSISDGLLDFFGRRLGMQASIASFRRADDDVLSRETAFARMREAAFVFSGPGSPSYALRQWIGSRVPELLTAKLLHGGALVLASAAALTVGRLTVPIYEIYKAGADPHWLDGLDLLSAIGIAAAVIPHYDNREGGDHDTRYCFLGESRLLALEALLPPDVFILGIDEHSALLIDLDAEIAFVHGRGGVTIRRNGNSTFHPANDEIALGVLQASTTGRPISAAPPATPAGDDQGGLARRLIELEAALGSLRERSALVEPLIETLLDARRVARANGNYEAADSIRDRLVALGLEITDNADGSTSYRLA